MKMREVTFQEYLDFVSKHKEIVIEDQVIRLDPIEVKRLEPEPDELTDVTTTVWSFPKRGSWATHKGDYRGNWAPQIPRALMLMYTRPGDVVLDQMCGSGTTLIEAKLLGRNAIGVDINYNAVILTLHRLYYLEKAIKELRERLRHFYPAENLGDVNIGGVPLKDVEKAWCRVYHGDARNLDKVPDESVDLIATHPPYWRIIRYSREVTEGDLSGAKKLEDYIKMMYEVARECYRVLKPGKYCAILIGDTRVNKHFVPISHYVLQVFLSVGFVLKEEIIKIQHKMRTTREVWSRLKERDFLLIYHEKLYVFRKPEKGEKVSKYRYSTRIKLDDMLA